jgi:hypothetical protein
LSNVSGSFSVAICEQISFIRSRSLGVMATALDSWEKNYRDDARECKP